MRILAVCGFIYQPVQRSRWYWFLLFGLNFTVQNLFNWAASDNHKWLFSYWFLAIGLSVGRNEIQRNLAINGRLLIGLSFLFATLRKITASEYVSGAAFRFLLQTDSRFFEIAKAVGGHRQHSGPIRQAMQDLEPTVLLPDAAALGDVAMVLTWWTIGIETAIAALFLWKQSPSVSRLGNALLLLFVATTYPIAPVLGFAWILLIMGLAQCPGAMQKLRLAYLVMFALVYTFHGEGIKILLMKAFYGGDFFSN